MRAKGWVQFAIFLLAVSMYAQSAFALPVEVTMENQHIETFNIDGGTATVESTVYSYDSGGFLYTYQITNESGLGLSFFSVGIVTGADAFNYSFEGAGVVALEPPLPIFYIFWFAHWVCGRYAGSWWGWIGCNWLLP